jgi:hypothetical protein
MGMDELARSGRAGVCGRNYEFCKIQNVLENYLFPSIHKLKNCNGDFTFQQDGASCHTSKSTKRWLGDHGLCPMKWPSSSPDLSPIETLWHEMKKKLRANPARNLTDLKIKFAEIWSSIKPEFCAHLVSSMRKRIACVIKRKGDPY